MNRNERNSDKEEGEEDQREIERSNQRERQPRRPPDEGQQDEQTGAGDRHDHHHHRGRRHQQAQQQQQQMIVINDEFVDQNRNLNLSNHDEKVRKLSEHDREVAEISSKQMTARTDERPHDHSNSPISSISCTTSGSECTTGSGAGTSTNSAQQQRQQQRLAASGVQSNGAPAKGIKFARHADEYSDHRQLDEFSCKLARDCSRDDDSIRINMLDINDDHHHHDHYGEEEDEEEEEEDHYDEHERRQNGHHHCELAQLIVDTTTTTTTTTTTADSRQTTTTLLDAEHIDDGQQGDENSFQLEKIMVASDTGERQQRREHQPAKGLVGQLERRMSLLPQVFARRLSRQHDQRSQNNNNHHHHHRPRLSLQTQSSFPASNLPEPQQPLTVAGVGGTITTVTRSKRKTAPLPRLVAKNGTVNLFLNNIDRSQYVRDLFTTMIDIKWRYNLMAAAFGFVFSWLLFACIWYCVLYVHNDLEHENDPNWSPCIVNVYSFPAALLFSIETQSTLGFGSRIISVECPGAIVIFCTQLIFGVVVECLIVGMVFAKLSRPAKRSQTIMYSKFATVCLRQGRMCLMFRVGDVRSKSHIIGATIRASLVSQKITEEGETIPFYHHQLKVRIDDSHNSLLLIWPLTIVHLIDQSSPFYELDAQQLANFKFEIITVLEGTVESTGQAIQVRSSYLPSEVKWGYRFEPIVSTHGIGKYAQTIIDYNKFNRVIRVETPDCSPKEFYSRRASSQSKRLGARVDAASDSDNANANDNYHHRCDQQTEQHNEQK